VIRGSAWVPLAAWAVTMPAIVAALPRKNARRDWGLGVNFKIGTSTSS